MRRKKKSYSKQEIDFLIENYPKYGCRYCAEKLNRHYRSIQVKANSLNIYKLFYKCAEGYKKCCRCLKELKIENFGKCKKDNYQTYCKKCKSEYKHDYLNKFRSTEEGRKKLSIDNLLNNAKMRAKQKKLQINIDKEFIKNNMGEFCPILGIKYEFASGSQSCPRSPSLDRVDNSKGYTKDNVKVISLRANKLKNDATKEEIEKILNYINNK